MTLLQKRLFALRDAEYAAFQSKLTPGIAVDLFIGVRVPILRKFVKAFAKEYESRDFLNELPHTYYDENMLHGLLISELKDYNEVIARLDAFLPYVDNWAVCDTMMPKVFMKHKAKLIGKIRDWIDSPKTYTCRFGIKMLMSFYLDADFKPEYLQFPISVRSEEYYVKMMVAWSFATALAKQWDDAIKIIENGELDIWIHNKTIQKAIESYRITEEKKTYLKTLRRGLIDEKDHRD